MNHFPCSSGPASTEISPAFGRPARPSSVTTTRSDHPRLSPASHRVLIFSDDASEREALRRLLAAHPEFTVVGEAGRLDEARALLTRDDYSLVVLDVRLRGRTCFDLAPGVRPGARLMFVTADPRCALRAFDVNALDYLLKPVSPARLVEALRRLPPIAPPSSVPNNPVTFLKTDAGSARFLPLRDIHAIFSVENYTELRLADRSRLFVRRTMKAWEQLLPAVDFMRVHRTAWVNLHAVEQIEHAGREVTHLFLASLGSERPVRSRRELWPELERRLHARKTQSGGGEMVVPLSPPPGI